MSVSQTDSSQDKTSAGSSFKFIARLIPFALKYKGAMLLAFIAVVAAAVFALMIPQGIRLLVDEGLSNTQSNALLSASLFMAGAALLYGVASVAQVYLVQRIGAKVVYDMRKLIFDKVISQGTPYFDKNRTGDIISRLNSDASTLGGFVSGGLSGAIVDLFVLIGIMVIMTLESGVMALIMAAFVTVLVVALRPLEKRLYKHAAAKQKALAESSICVDEHISGVRTVHAFNQTGAAQNAFAEKAEDVATASTDFGLVMGLFTGISGFAFYTTIAALLFSGGHLMVSGTLTAGEFSSFMVYAFFAISAGRGLINFIGSLNQTFGATKRLFEILDTDTVMPEPSNPRPLPQTDGPRSLKVEGVNFAYPSRPDQRVFTGLDLTIRKGETVAVVGPSGGGKSTLFKLFMREYDPAEGCVKLDDVNLRELSHKDLRSSLVPVPQDPSIFSLSVLENIRYGKPDASQEEVVAAAKAAHAHDFIERLADGYDTYVGEKGVQLSGGQKQRVAIARAFLCQPQVLLLDEATSNLDAQSEQAIKEALETIKQGRTTLIIAHRLATVIHADRILVMDNGQIVDEGPHDALMESSELYRSLIELQMLKQ